MPGVAACWCPLLLTRLTLRLPGAWCVQSQHGDLFVTYTVLFPQSLSPQQQQAVRELFKGAPWQEPAPGSEHDEL